MNWQRQKTQYNLLCYNLKYSLLLLYKIKPCNVRCILPSDGCDVIVLPWNSWMMMIVMMMMMVVVVVVQLLVSHTYRCSPCLQPTTVNKIVTSDVSTSLEIISNYIETVVPCLACMPHFITAHKLPYDDEVKSSHWLCAVNIWTCLIAEVTQQHRAWPRQYRCCVGRWRYNAEKYM